MRRFPTAVFAGLAAFVVALACAASLPDNLYELLFCRIPAWLAAAFFRADLDGASLTLGTGRVVAVTRACGGSDFFALVCAVLSWHAVRRKDAVALLLAGCGAWVFTVLVNGLRITVTIWARAVAERFLPERTWGSVHLASGVLVFFPALMLLWWLCTRHGYCGQSETES